MSTNMEESEADMMTVLTPGNVEGENKLCTTLRADIEKSLIAHITAEMTTMGGESN